MFPLGDRVKSGKTPYVTNLLICVNILVAIYMLLLSELRLEDFVNTFALYPNQVTHGARLMSVVTSMFLHGSLGHIIGNMLFLRVFGDNMEARLGRIPYLVYYLICGVIAALAQIASDPLSEFPILGASGAIAGVMGGYVLLFPNHPIDVLIPLLILFPVITIPAYSLVLYWLGFQVIGSIVDPEVGIAYFAHIAGFVSGLVLISLLGIDRRKEVFKKNRQDRLQTGQ